MGEEELKIDDAQAKPNPNNNNNNNNNNLITKDQFHSWKSRKDADVSSRRAEEARKRAQDIASGTVQMNGRELFANQPWVFDNTLY